MKTSTTLKLCAWVVAAIVSVGFGANTIRGQNAPPRQSAERGGAPPVVDRYPWDHPTVIFQGEPYTERSISTRNDGDRELGRTALPPHKIIGNLYWVGTQTLASYLITTPQGHILVNSTYEENVKPVIQKSVEQLGVKFSDIKILIGNHAHGDHQEGDALVKEMTGAQVMVMAEDVDLVKTIKPAGKEHPIDKVFHDGDSISLGGTTLVAHLTPGHTHGATTYTTTIMDGGRPYNVVMFTSFRLRSPYSTGPEVLNEATVAEFNRSFKWVSTLKCDVPLGDHTEEFLQREKYAKLKTGGPNPYIDPEGCRTEAHLEEAMLHAVLAEINANPSLAIRPPAAARGR